MSIVSGHNFLNPQVLTFGASLILNGQVITTSPFTIQEEGFFTAKLDDQNLQFALVKDPQLNYEGVEFEGSTDRFWREAQALMADQSIWDHDLSAYPLFREGLYRVTYFVDQPCFVALYMDDKPHGKMACSQAGRNAFVGVQFSRGRHRIRLAVEVG